MAEGASAASARTDVSAAARRRRCRRGQIGAVVRGRRFASSRARVYGGRRLRRGSHLRCTRFRKPARGIGGTYRATARLLRSRHFQRPPIRRLLGTRLARAGLRLRGPGDRALLRTVGGAGIARSRPRAQAAFGPLRAEPLESRELNASTTLEKQTRVAEESPGEIGSYSETEIKTTTDGRKTPSKVAGTIKRGAVLGEGTSFGRCPDSSGVVRGEYKSRQAESIAVDFPGPDKGSYTMETTVEPTPEGACGRRRHRQGLRVPRDGRHGGPRP